MTSLVIAMVLALLPLQRPADIVKWSADPPSKPVRAGGVATIELTANIAGGWKLYALAQPKGGPIPLRIEVGKGSPFEVARTRIVGPAAKVQKDELFPVETQYHEKTATFVVPVTVPKTADAKTHLVPLEVTFQACGESICLRPFTQRLDVAVSVVR